MAVAVCPLNEHDNMRSPGRRKVFVFGARQHSGVFHMSGVAAFARVFIVPRAHPGNSFAASARPWLLNRRGPGLPTGIQNCLYSALEKA